MATTVLSGAIIMGYAIAGLFFLRFWRRTKDRLFLMFALAFFLLGLTHVLIVSLNIAREDMSWVYVVRLAAFSLIILAIVMKNTESKRHSAAARGGAPSKPPSNH